MGSCCGRWYTSARRCYLLWCGHSHGGALDAQEETCRRFLPSKLRLRVVDVLHGRVNSHNDLVPSYVLDEVRCHARVWLRYSWLTVVCATVPHTLQVKEANVAATKVIQRMDKNYVTEYRDQDIPLFLRGDLRRPVQMPVEEAEAFVAAEEAKQVVARTQGRLAGGPVSLLSPAEAEDSLSAAFNFQVSGVLASPTCHAAPPHDRMAVSRSAPQRKIQPWHWMSMEATAAGKDLSHRPSAPVGTTTITDRAGRPCQPVIIVASFVNKAANLGGLTRTCEIFSAESLVIGDKKWLVRNPRG